MGIYKKFLMVAFVVVLGLLVEGCSGKAVLEDEHVKEDNMDSAKDSIGYPNDYFVIINGEKYTLENINQAVADSHITHEIELNLKEGEDLIEVILPQISPVNIWDLGAGEYIDLISYEKYEDESGDGTMLEGESTKLQKFKFVVPNDMNIKASFKWANVKENERAFKDKAENYLLNIKITHQK